MQGNIADEKDNLPSLFYGVNDCLSNLVNNDIISIIDKKPAKEIIKNNVFVASQGFTYESKVYGYPTITDNGYFLWYNNEFLSEEDVKSLENIIQVSKELGKTIYFSVDNSWYANSFVMSPQACGLQSLKWHETDDGKRYYETNWDNEIGVKVSKYIANLISSNVDVIKRVPSYSIINDMKYGNSIAVVSGLWMEEDYLTALNDKLSACKLPEYHIDGKSYQMASFGGGKGYFVNKNKSEKEIQTANLLAQLLTTKEAQLLRFELTRKIPTRVDVINDEKFINVATKGDIAFAEQSKYSCVQAQVVEDRYWEIADKIGAGYYQNKLEGKTWAEFLKEQMDVLRSPK